MFDAIDSMRASCGLSQFGFANSRAAICYIYRLYLSLSLSPSCHCLKQVISADEGERGFVYDAMGGIYQLVVIIGFLRHSFYACCRERYDFEINQK